MSEGLPPHAVPERPNTMRQNRLLQARGFLLLLAAVVFIPMQTANACTRLVYLGPDGTIVTARSMDWASDIGSNLWIFPRGMQREGAAGPDSITWTSKYGSVITSAFDRATADGMNEKGLVANLLYFADSKYPDVTPGDKRRPISISAWAQFVLDHYATVDEAVKALRQEPLYVVAVETPDHHAGSVHLAISDPTGDSAIFEYVDHKLVIHHGRQYQVMTNSPVYDDQLALDAYWKQVGGTAMLPGTYRSADRFARASYYVNAVARTPDHDQATAIAFSIIRNVSVPLGLATPAGQPNLSSTLWRTVSDHEKRRYYFESTSSPSVFWVELAKVDFGRNATAKTLVVSGGAVFSGNAAGQFRTATPFEFLDPTKPAEKDPS
jgi:penicillin V acylase-like amidase (Ntn superfamily)